MGQPVMSVCTDCSLVSISYRPVSLRHRLPASNYGEKLNMRKH